MEDDATNTDIIHSNELSQEELDRIEQERQRESFYRQQNVEMEKDEAKWKMWVTTGGLTGTDYDQDLITQARSSFLNQFEIEKIEAKYKCLLLCRSLGEDGKLFGDRLRAEIIVDLNLAASRNGSLLKTLHSQFTNISRTLNNSIPQKQNQGIKGLL